MDWKNRPKATDAWQLDRAGKLMGEQQQRAHETGLAPRQKPRSKSGRFYYWQRRNRYTPLFVLLRSGLRDPRGGQNAAATASKIANVKVTERRLAARPSRCHGVASADWPFSRNRLSSPNDALQSANHAFSWFQNFYGRLFKFDISMKFLLLQEIRNL